MTAARPRAGPDALIAPARRSVDSANHLPRPDANAPASPIMGPMVNHYDIAYGLGVGVSAPYWLIKPSARRKVLTAFRQRMGKIDEPGRDMARPAVMIHAVSLGEINATQSLV